MRGCAQATAIRNKRKRAARTLDSTGLKPYHTPSADYNNPYRRAGRSYHGFRAGRTTVSDNTSRPGSNLPPHEPRSLVRVTLLDGGPTYALPGTHGHVSCDYTKGF
eukprot:4129330-Prymnesium_polylepis.1